MHHLLTNSYPAIPTERGGTAKEMRNAILCVEKPGQEPIVSDRYYFPEQYRNEYCRELLKDHGIYETVYSRVLGKGKTKISQYKVILEKLRKNRFTRRAVMTLWEPEQDLHSEHPPCVCMMQSLIRDGKLNLTIVLRSNDAWLSALPDMIVFSRLQSQMAKDLTLDCGEYVHHAISYHIYDYDYSMAQSVFYDYEERDLNII